MTTAEILDKFVEYIQEKYPNVEPIHIKKAAVAPFHYARKEMIKDDFKTVRLLGLGTFRVHKMTAINKVKEYKQLLKNKQFTEVLDEETLKDYIQRLEKHIESCKMNTDFIGEI